MISDNLKYPEVARLTGISGEINVSFKIDTSGKVTEVTPLNRIGAGCESEAVKAFYCSKLWLPGMQDHRNVAVMFTVPIRFTVKKRKSIDERVEKIQLCFFV